MIKRLKVSYVIAITPCHSLRMPDGDWHEIRNYGYHRTHMKCVKSKLTNSFFFSKHSFIFNLRWVENIMKKSGQHANNEIV